MIQFMSGPVAERQPLRDRPLSASAAWSAASAAAALQRQSAQHRRLLAQYGVSEARLANADEMGSMLEEGGGDDVGSASGGIVLQAVVQRVEKAKP